MKLICLTLLIIRGITDSRAVVVGRPPVITVDGFDYSGGLHLQCESDGWYPEPDLEWLDSEGVSLSSETKETHINTDGFSVKHTITVHERDSKIHCRFKLRHHMLETLIITTSNMFNSWRTSVIVISVFVVLGVIAGILIAVFAHKNKEQFQLQNNHSQLQNNHSQLQNNHSQLQSEQSQLQSEHSQLQSEKGRIQQERDQLLQRLKTILPKVNVILDADTAHRRLIVSRDGKQVRYGNTQTERVYRGKDRFDCYLGVVGKEGFSSGCFYFEVQVKGQTMWDLGVARASAVRRLFYLNPERGYWIVGRIHETYLARGSSNYSLSLSVDPQTVGVFVNYEKGLVSFYDVESSSHIYTYTNLSFKEKLYPFVCLGYNSNTNSTPLIICDD